MRALSKSAAALVAAWAFAALLPAAAQESAKPAAKKAAAKSGKAQVKAEPKPKKGYFAASVDRSIKIDEPSWLALRVSARASSEFGRPLFAHTSPIYVRVGGKAIRQMDEVAYLIKQMEDARREIGSRALFGSPKEREDVLSVYEKGIRTLQNAGDP